MSHYDHRITAQLVDVYQICKHCYAMLVKSYTAGGIRKSYFKNIKIINSKHQKKPSKVGGNTNCVCRLSIPGYK